MTIVYLIQKDEKGANIKLILHIRNIASERLSSYPSIHYREVSKMRILM